MRKRYVYKVVIDYKSTHATGSSCVFYAENIKSKAEIGRLFVFSVLKSAKIFASHQDSNKCKILRCIYDGRMRRVRKVISINQIDRFLKIFWGNNIKMQKQIIFYSPLIDDSFTVESLTPISEVLER